MVVQIEQRKPWADDALLLLIGPGGAGKSTVGSLLAPLLRRRLIDLDHCFTERYGLIDHFITERGYDEYKITNNTLADDMANQLGGPSILVLSSGFLSMDNQPDILAANRMVVASGYSIGLLPSLDPDEAARIIVARQMSRGHGLDTEREVEKVRSRFAVYKSAGDMLVVSAAASHQIVSNIVCHCV